MEKTLKKVLDHEDNDPLEIIKIEGHDIPYYVNIDYCCFGTSRKEDGTIEEQEKKLMKAFDDISSCILIYSKYNTLEKFKSAFDNEMHWINQQRIRIERWNKIAPMMFKKIKKNVNKVGLKNYIENNFDSLMKILPAQPRKIELDSMDRKQLLEELAANKITTTEADELIAIYDEKIAEQNRDKLCPFSGNYPNPHMATGICSRTGDPKILGNCASCRVAAEWEECYG